jgi:acetylornithine/N-succinyldiaminopimelate aminotransferase
MQGNLEPGPQYATLGKKMVDLASKNSRLKHCWFATCGTMANENALKLARQKHSPARFIVSMENAFAGRSTMMAEVTDNAAYRQGLPRYEEVLRVPFYDAKDPQSSQKSLAKLKEHVEKHPKDIACFSFEPMLGEGGFKWAPREFFIPMLEFCKEQGIAVWMDEVQTFMRTGELFAFETLGIGHYADLVTVAKTLQTGATLYTEEYNPKPGLIAGTFSGGSAALAAGEEILDIMTGEGYLGPNGKISKIHKEFVSMLNRLNETTCKGQLRDAGGMGLMIAVTPLDGGKDTVTKFLFTLYKNGLIAYSCGHDPYRLRFLIPAVMESKDIELAGKIIEKSIQEHV